MCAIVYLFSDPITIKTTLFNMRAQCSVKEKVCNWASEASPTLGCSIKILCDICNSYKANARLNTIYKSRDTRAKTEWQGFMNCIQAERWFITIF